MAKIKSPLLMADGARVRTMEELREHFDIASVLAYYDNGKLCEWLENYYYDEEADKINALDLSSADIKEKICNILGVSCPGDEAGNIDLADISDKNKRIEKLKKFTADDEFLKAVDYVAFTQGELQNLLDGGAKKIYLCYEQEKFEIPNVEGVTYIGVNHPSATVPEWYDKKGIVLQNVDIGIEKILRFAKEYAEKKIYDEAVKLWKKAAELGDVTAQCELGNCYGNGVGVEQDEEEAFRWYKKAAEQGDADAQHMLNIHYSNGKGVGKNEVEVFKRYKKAAEQGDVNAQYMLGVCYSNGEGVGKNEKEAFKWYKKAAEQGNADAQSVLGRCYYYGDGVGQDYGEAYKWYMKVAKQGNADAQYMLGVCYDNGKGVAQDKWEAYKWYEKAAEQGDADAQFMLDYYDNEKGVDEVKEPYIEIEIPYLNLKEEYRNQKHKHHAYVYLEEYMTTIVLIHFCNMPMSNYTAHYHLEKNEYASLDDFGIHNYVEVEWGNWVSKDVCELKITKNNDEFFGELKIQITVDEVESAVGVIEGSSFYI